MSQQQTKPPKRIELAFLPAALEVLETPPSPIGRTILWVIFAAAALALTWASLAQLDVVAVAEGRIIPRARLQSVEAAEAGIVRAIHVREGQRVSAGEPLIGLDPTFADADGESAAIEYATARLARVRTEALLAYADGQMITPAWPEDVDPAAIAAETQALTARIAALRERLAGVDSRIAGARAARDSARADRQGLEETLPLNEEQLQGRRNLEAEGFAARAQVAQLEERVLTQRRAIEAGLADERQAGAEIAMLRRERQQALEDFRAQAASERAEAEAITATRAQGVRRAQLREGLQVLTAPTDGIVNEISVTTIGEVVEAGAPMATIVPAGSELIVEALILNRDVGFVAPGQQVIVKLEAFPFTRHGYIEGIVEHVSADAIADEARGLVFPARIRITGSRLRNVDQRLQSLQLADNSSAERETPMREAARPDQAWDAAVLATLLSPGMSAQVEVITARRSVLSYLLSPIARAASEAGRER